jgi:cytochrome c biogenesis protein CcdA
MKKYFFLIFFLLLATFASASDFCSFNETTCDSNATINIIPEINSTANLNSLCIVLFYGNGCTKCAQIEPYIESIEKKYSDRIHVERYQIYNDIKNYQIYNNYCSIQNLPLEKRGIPLIAINDKFFMGVQAIQDNLEPEIQELLKTGKYVCPLGSEMCLLNENITITNDTNNINPNPPSQHISLWLVIFTGLIDGINPCAFAVLIFLLTFLISVSGNKKRMITAGVTYTIAVYVSYFLAGFGLLSVIQLLGFSRIIVKAAAVLAIIAGLINIKDFFWYGKGFSLKIPESRKGTIEKWIYKANIPAAIVLGFLVSMFELPCTGGVYLAIIAMMASQLTKIQAVGFLLLYNLMFILPLLVIILLVTKGMKAEHIESWRESKKSWMKLFMGLVLLLLGAYMLLA